MLLHGKNRSQVSRSSYILLWLIIHLANLPKNLSKVNFSFNREKDALHRKMESLQLESLQLRDRVEELRRNKQEAERQLLSSQETHRQQMLSLQQDRRDEANSRETLDRRLADLRSEVNIPVHPHSDQIGLILIQPILQSDLNLIETNPIFFFKSKLNLT